MPDDCAEASKTLHHNALAATSMRLKIGVMGGATGVMSREVLEKSHALGRAIAGSGASW
jgi:hypothetical protein